ncbi:CTP synthetase [Halobacteriales archaeon QH_10_67_13]|nr:MAG: CTP synthetase [Halobacteriales archaeon QH_10_67_13]
MKIIIGGADDRGLARALDVHDVTHATTADAAGLESAGVSAADAFVLTDLEQATAIPVAKDRNPELTVLVYANGSLPEFVTRQADKLLDPALFDPGAIADALE